MLYSINITLTIILIFFIPIYIILYILLKNRLYKLNLKTKNSQDRFFSNLTEQIINIKLIKINSSFELYKLKVEKSFKYMFGNLIDFSKISYFLTSLDKILSTIAGSIVFFIGGIKVINNELSIGEFTIIITYFNMIISTISYYLNIGKSFQNCKSSFDRIEELLDIPKEVNGDKFIDTLNEIKIDKVSFSYDNKCILDEFSYTFRSGNIYCIKGNNGVGKSTLLNIIIGLISDYSNGSIYFNQININQLDMYKIRKELFSIVPQDYILKDVELENILNKIKNRKKYSNNFEYSYNINNILSFLNKINLELDENKSETNTFSGGENQKLAIFNAFLKKADVIILDEPTASLDKDSKELLKRILLEIKSQKLIILISHDNCLFDICDEFVDLNKVAD